MSKCRAPPADLPWAWRVFFRCFGQCAADRDEGVAAYVELRDPEDTFGQLGVMVELGL